MASSDSRALTTHTSSTLAAAAPHLLHFRVSHYNEKVRWALDYKGWSHRRTALVPGFHVPRVRWLTGQNKVPVLIVDGRALADSSRIIAELERLRPDPPLYPSDEPTRKQALAIAEYFDTQVAPDLRRLFWSTYVDRPADAARLATDGRGRVVRFIWRALWPALRPVFRRNMGLDASRVAAARQRLDGFFDYLERAIGPSGYLAGDHFSVADLTAAAVMTAVIRPPQFSYPLPEPWPPALVALRNTVAQRPGCKWVLDIYARHRGESRDIDAR